MNLILFFKLRPVDDLFDFVNGCCEGSHPFAFTVFTVLLGEPGEGGVFDRVVFGE